MPIKKRFAWPALLVLTAVLVPAVARAGTWEALNYGGSNTMNVYRPTSPAASPAIIVSLHFCGGSMANAQGWFQSYADRYGFLIIAGKSTGGCWDAALGRSGERAAIVQAVTYVIQNYKADKTRVFVAGPSSGACMTQSMLASYPEVFAGGSSLAGVPAGAWTGGANYGWSAPSSTTAQQWGDKVRQTSPSFTGARPRIQFWQGQGDTNLTYAIAYPAQVAQWTNVFGVTEANATKTSIKPAGAQDTWDRTSYKDGSGTVVVEANSGPSNVPHDLTPRGLWSDVVRFFGLDGSGPVVTPDGGAGGSAGASGAGGASAGGRGGGNDGSVDSGNPATDAMASGRGGEGGNTSGAVGANGGAGANGGVSGTAGTNGVGGVSGGAGTSGGDGTPASGGSSVQGAAGASSSGGVGSSAGASGGSTAGGAGSDAGGCGCALAARKGRSTAGVTLLTAALALVGRRLRRKRRRDPT